MRGWCIALLGLCSATCSASLHPTRRALPKAVAAAARPAPPPRLAASERSSPWAKIYERPCDPGVGAWPEISPSGLQFVACGAAFALESGRYLGRASLYVSALLSDEQSLQGDFTLGGLLLGRTLGAAPTPVRQVPGGFVSALALNPARDCMVALEHSEAELRVVVRSLPELTQLASVALGGDGRGTALAFLADGRVLLATKEACPNQPCVDPASSPSGETRALFWLDGERFRPLWGGVRGLLEVAVSADGTRVLLGWANRRELVAASSGERLAVVDPPAPDPPRESVQPALDAHGRRAAFFGQRGLEIVEFDDRLQLTRLHTDPGASSGELRFSPDGRSLLLGKYSRVLAYREGGTVSPLPPANYEREQPGFERDDDYFTEHDSVPPIGFVARYWRERPWTEVMVTATAAAEFGTPSTDLTSWAALLLEREDAPEAQVLGTWQTPDGRALEFANFTRKGCDTGDYYVRFMERGALLYRVELMVLAGTPRKRVTPLLHGFFDAPFGAPLGARNLVTVPRAPSTPC